MQIQLHHKIDVENGLDSIDDIIGIMITIQGEMKKKIILYLHKYSPPVLPITKSSYTTTNSIHDYPLLQPEGSLPVSTPMICIV